MDVYVGQTDKNTSWFADFSSVETTAEAIPLLDVIVASDNSSRSPQLVNRLFLGGLWFKH